MRLSSFHPDILAITEVCPKHYHVPIPPESLHLQGYDLFCSDFSGSRGVCLYCKSSLKADKYDNSKFNDFKESLWCSVPVDKNNFILVGVIYRSPSSSTDNDTRLMDLITEAIRNCKPHLLIMGDFNFPDINWEEWSSGGKDTSSNTFLSTLYDNFLFQHIEFPTRYRENMNPSLLDLVITNEENTILNIHSTEPLGKRDHIVLIFEYCCQLVVPVATYTRYLYDKGDYELINEDLFNEDWMVLFQDLNVSAMWEIFHSKLLYLMNKYIPSINFSSTKVRSHPLWLNKEILRVIKLKHKAWNKYLITRQKSDFDAYSKIRNHSTFMVRKARLLFEAKLATNVKDNPKKFWSYVNQTIKVKPGVSMLEQEDGTVIEKDADIAEALNEVFLQ